MAFEIARIHDSFRSLTENLETADGPCFDGLDLSSSSASSIRSPSPFSSVLESSTEAESSEDDDFVAELAEQMAHSMLEDSDDEFLKAEDCIGMRVQGDSWGNFSHKSQNPQQVNWSVRNNFMAGGLISGSQSPPLNAFSVERDAYTWDGMPSPRGNNHGLWNEGMNRGHGDLEHLLESQVGFPWQWGGASQLPFMQNFPEHSFLGQNMSPAPLCPSAAIKGGITNPKAFHHPSKQQDLDDLCKFTCNGARAAWARNTRPHQLPNHMANAKLSHAKGGLQHKSGNIALQGNGSGMRAVFLGGNGTHKESTGTGVFLPLSSKYQKRKSVCSTVLLPSRVVDMLNLQLDGLRHQPLGQTRSAPTVSIQQSQSSYDGAKAQPKSKNTFNRPFSTRGTSFSTSSQLHQASRLPSEWAY